MGFVADWTASDPPTLNTAIHQDCRIGPLESHVLSDSSYSNLLPLSTLANFTLTLTWYDFWRVMGLIVKVGLFFLDD